MTTYIGTSGWSYAHWQGVLYPEGTPQHERLSFYTSAFSTVELNSSFYRWPKDSTFTSWRRRLPPEFIMSVKAPRGLSHGKKLYAPEKWLAIIERSWHALAEKRGILLVQLPPSLTCDFKRLEYFLQGLPQWLRTTIEFRHNSWHRDEVFDLLEKYQVAYCVMSGADLPCVLRSTASFVYIRLHGPDHNYLYGGSYSEADLSWWAARIKEYQHQNKDVFVYFNNDGHGHAVNNARRLIELVF